MRIYIMLMFTIILALFAACAEGSSEAAPLEVVPNEPFSLQAGQAALLKNSTVSIVFDGVTADSRCPATAECITAGSVSVQISVNDQFRTLTLEEVIQSDDAFLDIGNGLTLELLEVHPYPASQEDTPEAVDTIVLVIWERS